MEITHQSQLISQLKDGSNEAFEAIYNSFWEDVYLSALKRVGDADIAKELTQELFIHLWERRSDISIRESLGAYLSVAIKYRVINHIRSAMTRERYHNDMMLLLGEQKFNDNDSYYAVRAIKDTLGTILAKMPERMRLVFSMSRLEQKTVTEIAGELDISTQTVKNQISSALKIIRKNGAFPILLLLFIYS